MTSVLKRNPFTGNAARPDFIHFLASFAKNLKHLIWIFRVVRRLSVVAVPAETVPIETLPTRYLITRTAGGPHRASTISARPPLSAARHFTVLDSRPLSKHERID